MLPAISDLHLRLLGHLKGIVNLDAKVSDGAFQLGMPEQELYGSKVLRPSIETISANLLWDCLLHPFLSQLFGNIIQI